MIIVAYDCGQSFLEKNQDHLYYGLTALATIGLFVITWRALHTWKKEKHFDLIIESLAFARECEEYLIELRTPFSSEVELTEEYRKKAETDPTSYFFYIYQSRQIRFKSTYERLIQFYYRNWAHEGENGLMTIFFKKIIENIRNINIAFNKRYWYRNLQDTDPDAFNRVYKETDNIIMSNGDKDDIEQDLKQSIIELEKIYRKKV